LLTSPPAVLLGALKPRIEIRPDLIVATEGDLAADLMEAAGKPLEQWQRDGVDLLMSTRADGSWACKEYAEWVARQQGKGVIGEARVSYGLLVLDEEITWSAHLYKTALMAFRRIRSVFRALGEVHKTGREEVIDIDGIPVKVWNSNNERGFERLDTEKKLTFFARSTGGLRGGTTDLNVIDEAFAYTFEQQDAIAPTRIAMPNAQTLYLSSPPLTGDSGDVMFALKKRAESGTSTRLGYRDWGLEGDLDDVERIEVDNREFWALTCPGLGRGRVTEETIEGLREEMSLRGFGREVLGLWPRQRVGGGAIDMAQWARLLDGLSRRDGDVTIAADIAPQRDYAAIGLYGLREDGLGHWQLVDYRPGVDWLVDRLVELKDALRPIGIAMGKGTFESLKDALREAGLNRPEKSDEPARGDLAVLTATDMTAATSQALDAVRQGIVKHIGQVQLDTAVAGAKTRETGDTVAWSRKDADADICPLVVVSEARWLYGAWAQLVIDADYDVLQSLY
jgi:hypothetical protein